MALDASPQRHIGMHRKYITKPKRKFKNQSYYKYVIFIYKPQRT